MSKPESVLIIDPAQELKFKGKRRKLRKNLLKMTKGSMLKQIDRRGIDNCDGMLSSDVLLS